MNDKCCRFCLDNIETKTNKLISPCLCNGSCKYVHEKCLSNWFLFDSINFKQCNTCNYNYKFENYFLIIICKFLYSNNKIVNVMGIYILQCIIEILFIRTIKYTEVYDYLYNILSDNLFLIICCFFYFYKVYMFIKLFFPSHNNYFLYILSFCIIYCFFSLFRFICFCSLNILFAYGV